MTHRGARLRRLMRSHTLGIFARAVVTIWAAITVTFFLIRLMPGSPADVHIDFLMKQQGMTYDEARARAEAQFKFDPDANVLAQYAEYIGRLARLDLGESITATGTRVIDQIARFLPWTVFSVGLGLFISFTLGVTIGALMAYQRGSWLDHSFSLLASILSAVPNYIWGLLILIVCGVQLGWFQIGALRGTYDPALTPGLNLAFILSVLSHAALPVLVYVLGSIGRWMLNMRSSAISALGAEYVSAARARGLPPPRIGLAYVGRNAVLPMFTLLATDISFIIGSSVIVEELFAYRGIGSFFYWSIAQRDYTSMQGVFLVMALAVVLSNLLADLLHGWLDPRVRAGGGEK
jgi:peptide/nickel transport system permease protein